MSCSTKTNIFNSSNFLNLLLLPLLALLIFAPVKQTLAAEYYLLESDSILGDRRVNFQIKPGFVADYLRDNWSITAGDRSQLSVHEEFDNVVIYRLKNTDLAATEEFLKNNQSGLAPVFVTDSGQYEIVIGGVVVNFKSAPTQAELEQFITANQLQAYTYSKPSSSPRLYMFHSNPGLPTLDLANDLHGLKELSKVYPNIWRNSYKTR